MTEHKIITNERIARFLDTLDDPTPGEIVENHLIAEALTRAREAGQNMADTIAEYERRYAPGTASHVVDRYPEGYVKPDPRQWTDENHCTHHTVPAGTILEIVDGDTGEKRLLQLDEDMKYVSAIFREVEL